MSTTTPPLHNSSLIEKVEGEVKKLGADIQGIAVKLFGQTAVDQFEATLKTILEDDVFTIFMDAVSAAETLQVGGTAASSDEKRAAAFSKIVSDLAAEGKSLATNVVNLGIELVVGLMKSKTPAAPATS